MGYGWFGGGVRNIPIKEGMSWFRDRKVMAEGAEAKEGARLSRCRPITSV